MMQDYRPEPTKPTAIIFETEVESWAKRLNPNSHSPLLVNFIKHVLSIERQPSRLQVSAAFGDVEEVKRLIAENSRSLDVISEENGRTALQAASAAGKLGIVKILIESGCDVNGPPSRLNGRTALQAAAEAGHCEIANVLIKNTANLSAGCCQRPNRIENHHECPGRTAHYFAAEKGHAEVLALLLGASAAQGVKPRRP
jgi:Ankyrin repeats (3 copies)